MPPKRKSRRLNSRNEKKTAAPDRISCIAKVGANEAAEETPSAVSGTHKRRKTTTSSSNGPAKRVRRSSRRIGTATKKRTQPVRAATKKVNQRNSANRKIYSQKNCTKEAEPQKMGLRRRHCTESGVDAKRTPCSHNGRRESFTSNGKFSIYDFNWNRKLEGE